MEDALVLNKLFLERHPSKTISKLYLNCVHCYEKYLECIDDYEKQEICLDLFETFAEQMEFLKNQDLFNQLRYRWWMESLGFLESKIYKRHALSGKYYNTNQIVEGGRSNKPIFYRLWVCANGLAKRFPKWK